jgi:uncharacterized protein YdeI (YjbR/CyaY-like superfamily)
VPTKAVRTKAAARKKKGRTDWESVPVRGFKSQRDFAAWLEKKHASSPGLWVRIAKKGSKNKSVTYQQALETALCYGWIDAHKRPESDTAWLQRFVRRRPKSIWSKINREKAIALIETGQMSPAGLAEVERAKKDGRWESAYDSPSSVKMPPDLQEALDRNPRAAAFFATVNRANRYAIVWRVHTAKKPETRSQRIRTYIDMLEKGKTLH